MTAATARAAALSPDVLPVDAVPDRGAVTAAGVSAARRAVNERAPSRSATAASRP